jgi:hypothetical protein
VRFLKRKFDPKLISYNKFNERIFVVFSLLSHLTDPVDLFYRNYSGPWNLSSSFFRHSVRLASGQPPSLLSNEAKTFSRP